MAKRGQSKYMTHLRAKQVAKPGVIHGYKSDVLIQHEANEAKAKVNDQKGKRGGDCNRTQCQRPHSWWYNKTMQAYYCGDCAGAINESCLTRDHIESFPNKIYVNPPRAYITQYGEDDRWTVDVFTSDEVVTCSKEYIVYAEAQEALRSFNRNADLRSDSSAPFHYSELPAKMRALKERIDVMNGHSVSPDEHSVGRDSK